MHMQSRDRDRESSIKLCVKVIHNQYAWQTALDPEVYTTLV